MRVGAVLDRRGARRQTLEVAHQVVTRDTDEPAVQWKAVAVRFGTRCPGERCAQDAEQGGLVGGPRLQVGPDAQSAGVEPQLEAVAETDERIARQPLAPFDALEQEARPEGLQLEKGRDRGVEIGGDVEQGSCGHTPVLCREDRGRTNEKPIPGGSRRWVLEISKTKLRAWRPLLQGWRHQPQGTRPE